MSAFVLLTLLNELGKTIRCKALPTRYFRYGRQRITLQRNLHI